MNPQEVHHRLISDKIEESFDALHRHEMGVVCHLPIFVSHRLFQQAAPKET